jgi:hypothetical protein
MTDAELMREPWQQQPVTPVRCASSAKRVERAAMSCAAISRLDIASACMLRRELQQAVARVQRLREAARQRIGSASSSGTGR